jgi:hypothetical protein
MTPPPIPNAAVINDVAKLAKISKPASSKGIAGGNNIIRSLINLFSNLFSGALINDHLKMALIAKTIATFDWST